MALQLVLSFGHIHLDRIASTPTAVTTAGGTSSAHPNSPAQHPANDADDYCAICAIIHLASTSFLSKAPALPLPFAVQVVQHFDRVAFIVTTPRRKAFQSRAPPLA
jgi:Protein of unknown function (DUF2946)